MTLIVSCKTCGRELRSQDRYAGLPVRCPQCGTLNVLPAEPVALPGSAICFLCGRDFASDSDLVKDRGGRYYHRQCYEGASRYEQARRAEELQRRQGGEPLPPPASFSSEGFAEVQSEHEPLGELEPSVDDLWSDRATPSARPATAWELQPTVRRDTAWLYVMIGFAAAVPAVVLLFIAVQLITASLELRHPQRPGSGSPPAASAPR